MSASAAALQGLAFAFAAVGDVVGDSAAALQGGDCASAAASGTVGDFASAAAAAVSVAVLSGLAGAGARLLFVYYAAVAGFHNK